MQIFRCTEPEPTAQLLAPFLLEDTDYSKETTLGMLMHYLATMPSQIQVLVAIDENSVLGHTISFAEQGTNHTFLLQAWVSNKAPTGLSKKLLSRVIAWTEDLGRTSIRMETKRSEGGFTRRFGFRPLSSIMELPVGLEHELTEDREIEVRTAPQITETQHGQEVQSEEHDTGSDEGSELAGELFSSSGGDGSDSLRAAFGSPAASGDATDPESIEYSEPVGRAAAAKRSSVTITPGGSFLHPGPARDS